MEQHTLIGMGACGGVAIGSVYLYQPLQFDLPERAVTDEQAEVARYQAACKRAKNELAALQERLSQTLGADEAAIFAAHQTLLFDPALAQAVKQHIHDGFPVEQAVQQAIHQIAEMFRHAGDDLLAGRADDIEDIGRRLLRILLDIPDTSLAAISEPVIIVAHTLSPSDTALLNPDLTQGLCIAHGGVTSHAAILARTLNIPAVVAVGDALMDTITSDTVIALDGDSGEVILNPTPITRAHYQERKQRQQKRTIAIQQTRTQLAHTADDCPIAVLANISGATSAQQAVEYGAQGVGLLRTEFLYLDRSTPPTEAEQIALYRTIFEQMAGRPITIRTLDIGGDKPPSFMQFPHEMNPFLGWRGARLYPDDPTLFQTQVKAILQAAVGHDVQMMYPMIESLETLRTVNQLVAEARSQLTAAGTVYHQTMQTGIMIETPSAALMIDMLAPETDFFSIGTNDLTQYTLATDRDNGQVAHYFQMFNPGVLRLIARTIQTANDVGRDISICGALAGVPLAIPLLLGMGLRKFSMVAAAIAEAKWLLRQITLAEAQSLADHILTLSDVQSIEQTLSQTLNEKGISPQ